MSYDFKLFFVFHISMMILILTHGFFSAFQIILFSATLFIILALLSIKNKQRFKWKWPGPLLKGLIGVFLNLAVGFIFLSYASFKVLKQNMPEISALTFTEVINFLSVSFISIKRGILISLHTPWYLAGIMIITFNILYSLGIVTQSKKEFLRYCKEDHN